jgi:hypothetical protein
VGEKRSFTHHADLGLRNDATAGLVCPTETYPGLSCSLILCTCSTLDAAHGKLRKIQQGVISHGDLITGSADNEGLPGWGDVGDKGAKERARSKNVAVKQISVKIMKHSGGYTDKERTEGCHAARKCQHGTPGNRWLLPSQSTLGQGGARCHACQTQGGEVRRQRSHRLMVISKPVMVVSIIYVLLFYSTFMQQIADVMLQRGITGRIWALLCGPPVRA